jgi:hypothetical protein
MKALQAEVCDGVCNWCWTRGGRNKMDSSEFLLLSRSSVTPFLLLSLAAAILLWCLRMMKGRQSWNFFTALSLCAVGQ